MDEDKKSEEKTTHQRLEEILKLLTREQLRFVIALQEYPTKDAAAKAIHVKPQTTYEWPEYVDEAARLLALDSLNSARLLRRRNLIKAMAVKAKGLDSKDERIRQSVATEIVEWELGKAQQPVDLTEKFDGIVRVVVHEDKLDGDGA